MRIFGPLYGNMEVKRLSTREITPEGFIAEHWTPGLPLVFTDAAHVWKAHGTFSPDWFREHFGDRTTVVDGRTYAMKEIMDLVEGKDTSRPVPYPIKYHIPAQLPELIDLITPINLGYAQPNWMESNWFARGNWGNALELFIGGPGGKFPYVHLDYYHLSAWVTQLYGNKEFTVWPRGQERYLYPDPNDPWRSVIPDIEHVDLKKFPLYERATPIKFVVGPGETLFIPFGIWHTAKSLEPTISVAFDLLNGRNFPDFVKDVWGFRRNGNKVKAAAITGYAVLAGSMCRIGDMMGVKRDSRRA
ncbi:MAG: cupin-like domain-containing protein [Flavobacteriales bacterium]|nr:cupin-like domain-containing protein [Flavobacteriales bacterium]MCB9167080.1 cupin-like domain-containing protein [Flavobacteriales bacterium]